MKNFHVLYNVGKAKYVISYHDGIKKYPDNSEFFDLRIFKNKKIFNDFISSLLKSGYVQR